MGSVPFLCFDNLIINQNRRLAYRQPKKGCDAAISPGLVPRQHSSGGKTVLLGISKRGDRYLRNLLVHGARSVVTQAVGKQDLLSCWLN